MEESNGIMGAKVLWEVGKEKKKHLWKSRHKSHWRILNFLRDTKYTNIEWEPRKIELQCSAVFSSYITVLHDVQVCCVE